MSAVSSLCSKSSSPANPARPGAEGILLSRWLLKGSPLMTKEDLMRLISLGEGQTIEFKRSLSEDFGREIVAFANTLGGTLLVGVDCLNR